ncbi:hypothetical protein [Streptococcus uberis]|nr:hypothetical protein [Streptococcus uberis]
MKKITKDLNSEVLNHGDRAITRKRPNEAVYHQPKKDDSSRNK